MNSFFMIFLLISISILCVLIGKLISNSILHPIILMLIMWIGFIFFPLLFWRTRYNWNYTGLIWIMLSILATELGALLVKQKTKSIQKIKKYDRKYDWKILLIVIIYFYAMFFTISFTRVMLLLWKDERS